MSKRARSSELTIAERAALACANEPSSQSQASAFSPEKKLSSSGRKRVVLESDEEDDEEELVDEEEEEELVDDEVDDVILKTPLRQQIRRGSSPVHSVVVAVSKVESQDAAKKARKETQEPLVVFEEVTFLSQGAASNHDGGPDEREATDLSEGVEEVKPLVKTASKKALFFEEEVVEVKKEEEIVPVNLLEDVQLPLPLPPPPATVKVEEAVAVAFEEIVGSVKIEETNDKRFALESDNDDAGAEVGDELNEDGDDHDDDEDEDGEDEDEFDDIDLDGLESTRQVSYAAKEDHNPVYNSKHVEQKKAVLADMSVNFDLWIHLLSMDFSVLLAGVGSKYELMHAFAQKISRFVPCIVIKGFTCQTKGYDLCMHLVDKLAIYFDCVPQTRNLKLFEKWKAVSLTLAEERRIFSEEEDDDDELVYEDDVQMRFTDDDVQTRFTDLEPFHFGRSESNTRRAHSEALPRKQVCVVVHNIDGLELRAPELQNLLCDIASTPEIELVASIDDVNMQKTWSKEQLERFRFWWIPVHTFGLYLTEDTMTRVAIEKKHVETSDEKIRRLLNVLASLSQKHQQMALALCNCQLAMVEAGVTRKDCWVTLSDWSKAEGMENIAFSRVLSSLLKELLQGNQLEKRSKTIESYRLVGMTKDELKKVRAQLLELINQS